MEEWNTSVWLGKIRKRGRTLVLPYILWNVLALLAGFAYGWLRSRFNPEVIPVSLLDTLRQNGWHNIFWTSTWGCPIDYPLWFIRDLIVFVALTPLVYLLVRKCRVWGVAVLFFSCGLTGRDFEGFFFFVLGAWFQLSSFDFIKLFSRIKWPAYLLSAVGVVLIALTYRDHQDVYKYVKYLFVFFGTVSTINFAAWIVERDLIRENAFLTSSSFFIFASHAILILHDFAHYITLHLLPFESVGGKIAVLFIKPTIAIGICLALYALMKKWTPKTLGVLTGNRA